MLDIHLIRENPGVVKDALEKRNYPRENFNVLEEIIRLDAEWRNIKKEEEVLRAKRNKLNADIIKKKKAGESADSDIRESAGISKRIKEIEEMTCELEKRRDELLLLLPAIPHNSVPIGKDESANVEIRRWGTPKKKADDVLSHYEIGNKTDLIDYERGVKLAEHRFTVLKGPMAKLERALINFMLSVQVTHGYTEFALPYLVNTRTITATGQLPKFASELYKCAEDDLWLIPTAEVPLTNLYAGEIIEEKNLPLRLTAFTPCFRREAGAYGKDIHGLMRQHQFDKVELVKIAHPNNSYEELEGMTRDAERILQLLELPYRVVALCTGDLGFASTKTYDIEVWIPSENRYREISSCSNCGDFQARRANIKYRGSDGKLHFVHTLNGSGLAVGRTLIAIMENYQENKKTIKIPKPLLGFVGEEEIVIF
ncbi:MAG: serine--tRNA ligase [Candidatus Bilamarchaeaceae archaeon]